VEASLKALLEPIFEADFQPVSYGFRPNRPAQDTIAEIPHKSTRGYEWVLEADIAWNWYLPRWLNWLPRLDASRNIPVKPAHHEPGGLVFAGSRR
jgi:hypothetical protein